MLKYFYIYFFQGLTMTNKANKKSSQTSILEKISLFDTEIAETIGKELIKTMNENPGMTLKEATGVSDEALEEIYCLAYAFYNQGKYKEAASLFSFWQVRLRQPTNMCLG